MTEDKTFLGIDSELGDDGDGRRALACPRCGEATGLHLNDVVVGGAGGVIVEVVNDGEDSSAIPRVNVARSPNASDRAKRVESTMGNHRRHFIEIIGWCEHCGPGGFGIVLKQHKGMTFVDVVAEPTGAPVDRS